MINEKILSIIKKKEGGNADAFANNIGATAEMVQEWMKGGSKPSNCHIDTICRQYNISLRQLELSGAEVFFEPKFSEDYSPLSFYNFMLICRERDLFMVDVTMDAGVDPAILMQWVNGELPSHNVISELAGILGVSIDDIISDWHLKSEREWRVERRHKQDVSRVVARVDDIMDGIVRLQEMRDGAQSGVAARMKKESGELEGHIEELQVQLSGKDTELEYRLLGKSELIQEQKERIADKDRLIAELERRATVAERRVEELSDEVLLLKNNRKEQLVISEV